MRVFQRSRMPLFGLLPGGRPILETRSATAKAVWLVALSKKKPLGVLAIGLQKAESLGTRSNNRTLQTPPPIATLQVDVYPGPGILCFFLHLRSAIG